MRVPEGGSPFRATVSRRALLAGAGAGVALLATACTGDAEPTTAPTVPTVPPVTSVDPLAGLVATTRLHVLNLQAAAEFDSPKKEVLAQLLADRQAHMEALLTEWARTDPDAAKAQAAITGQVPPQPDADTAIGQVRTDAADGRTQLTDIIGSVSRHRAALLGTIAAGLETHRVVLA